MPFRFPDRPGCTVEELRGDLKNDLFPHITRKTISATVGTNQTDIAHGLPEPPTWVGVTPRGDARVWMSQESDGDRVYLTASASVDVIIEVSCA